jgi:nitroreductase
MNDIIQTLLKRRSIRLFKDDQIKKEDLDEILECARYAPSANNTQNWHFTVIRSRPLIDKVNSWIILEINKAGNPNLQRLAQSGNANVFRNAPCVILVSTEKQDRFGIVNISAATQNILIAAESLGLGSCWIGMVGTLATSEKANEYAKDLGIPDGYVPYFGITLGYKTDDSQQAPSRRENIITYF